MYQGAPVKTEGPEAEFGFEALCLDILSGRLPVWSAGLPDPDLERGFVVPFAWTDTPDPFPLAIVEITPDKLAVHSMGPPWMPRHARRRFVRRLGVLAGSINTHRPPPDFDLLEPAEFMECIRAYEKSAHLRHPHA